MKKHISNGLSFAAVGIIIGLTLSIIFSYLSGTGNYSPSSENFVNSFATPLDALLVSIILWGMMGLVFGFGSLIFSIKRWSTVKQTIINFIVYFIGFAPLAAFAGWFPLTLGSWITFMVIFCLVYAFCWIIGRMINHVNKTLRV